MLAKEVMSTSPEFVPPTATIAEVAKVMKQKDFGFVPIGENDRLIGVITDRDIAIRAIAHGKDPNKTVARDILSEHVYYCFESDDIKKVVNSMEDLQVRRLIVLNKSKRMVGIISLGDIARKCKDKALSGELAEAVSET